MGKHNLQVLAALPGLPLSTLGGELYLGETATGLTGVVGCAASHCAKIIAVVTLQKQAIVAEIEDGKLKEVARHDFPKRLTGVLLTGSTEEVMVCDAFGDVYKVPSRESVKMCDEGEQERYRILGHLSTVTDMGVADGLVATGDRDGKLRMSRFPEAFVIESFCLGHEEFISCVVWTRVEGRVISGAGDGSLRLWNAQSGDEISRVKLCEWEVVKGLVGGEVVVGKVVCVPWDVDKAVFALTECACVFEMSGIASGTLSGLRVVTRLEGAVTGIDVDEDGVLWVSTDGERKVYKYDVRQKKVGMELESCGFVEISEENEKGDEGELLTRFRWLSKQRKKEMVEDWKGKKRRYVEM